MSLRPVLYVEDDDNDAFFLKRAFRQVGISHPLVVVSDGQKAIDYCAGLGDFSSREDHPLPCLILLDLKLPKKSGMEVLDWVRKERSIATVPVIMLTSSLQDADIHQAYLHGANAYLGKPSDPADLVATVKTIQDFWLTQNRTATKSADSLPTD